MKLIKLLVKKNLFYTSPFRIPIWISFLICFVLKSPLYSQTKEEVIVQSGHFGRINHITFSSDNRLLASAGDDLTLRIWHINTGKLMATFQHPTAVVTSCFNESEEQTVSIATDGILRIWSITHSQQLREVKLVNTSTVQAKILRHEKSIYALINNQLFKAVDHRAEFQKIETNIEDFRIENNGSVEVFTTNQSLKKLNEKSQLSEPLFSGKKTATIWHDKNNQQSYIFEHLAARIQRNRIELYNLKSGKKKTFQGDYLDDVFTDVRYSAKNKLAIVSNTDNKIYLIDTEKKRIVKKLNEHVDDVFAIGMSSDERLFASAGNDRSITVWDMATLKPQKTLISKTYRIETIDFVPETQQIAFGDELGNLKLMSLADKNLSVQSKKIHKYPLVLLSYDQGSFYTVGKDNRIKKTNDLLVTEASNKVLKRFSPTYSLLNTFKFYYESPVQYQSLKIESSWAAVETSYSKIKIRAFDKESLHRIKHLNVSFDKKYTGVPDYIQNSPLFHQGGLTDYKELPEKFLTSGAEGSIKLWDKNEKKLLVTCIPLGNRESKITITSDNYYMVDKASLEGIAFKLGSKLFLPQQFDLKFNRPDLVLARMGGFSNELIQAYHHAYQKRITKAGFTEKMLEGDELNVPELQILTTNIPYKTDNPAFSLLVECRSEDKKLRAINVLVNGVPIFGTQGLSISDENSLSVTKTISIPLSNGINKISLSVYNDAGLESLREALEIMYETSSQQKPTLHLVTIGVSEYKNDAMNLQYAAKDGQDLASLYKNQKGVFKEVINHSLINEDVTTSNVLKLKEKLYETNVNDVVMIFVAGHGLLDKELDYYFATHNVNFLNPKENGLRYDDLETLLDGIPARNKILLIDACHSGEIDKEEIEVVVKNETIKNNTNITFRNFGNAEVRQKNLGLQNSFELSKQLFTDLRKGSGTTVLSAAGGVQLAQESSEWKNGAFTYCLLSGLRDMKADLNKDNKIMLSELRSYLFTEVSKITGGLQQPTSRIENLEIDWQIW
ncbi:MAG: caspase family protein [Cyclobacteriaceae bacterium]|nr:caspase family protein [Cyclobacteriaceae bacterium]